jgi:hypothetical protein
MTLSFCLLFVFLPPNVPVCFGAMCWAVGERPRARRKHHGLVGTPDLFSGFIPQQEPFAVACAGAVNRTCRRVCSSILRLGSRAFKKLKVPVPGLPFCAFAWFLRLPR